jgi:hypothetical protein
VNPSMPLGTTTVDAPDLQIGVYKPDRSMVSKLNDVQPINVITSAISDGFRHTESGLHKGSDENNPQVEDV